MTLFELALKEARKFYADCDWTLAAVLYKHAAQMAEVEKVELPAQALEHQRRANIRCNMDTFPEQVFELVHRRLTPVVYSMCPFCTTEYYTLLESRPVDCTVCEGAASLANQATDAVEAVMVALPKLPRTQETLERVCGWTNKLGDMLFRVDFGYFCKELEEELRERNGNDESV